MSDREYQWARLDTAAKIFPPTVTKQDPKVFRFSCDLTEQVQPDLLQEALEQNLTAFPAFRTVLCKGLFWYYLEQTTEKPKVREEYRSPCGPLYDPDVHSLLFEVTYYRNRINLELFHAIADGTGAMEFTEGLIFRYLKLAHHAELAGLPELAYCASDAQSMDDSFERYANPAGKHKVQKARWTYHLRGAEPLDFSTNVVLGTVPVDRMLELSRRNGTSLTVLICAILIQSIGKTMAVLDRGKTIVLAIPVNLRNHFESSSARNFFGIMDVSHNLSRDGAATADIVKNLARQFKEGLSEDNLQFSVNRYLGLIKSPISRASPLVVKNGAMRIGSLVVSGAETAAVSNIGIIRLPEELSPYLDRFNMYNSTGRIQLCIVSYGNRMTLNFSSAFLNMDVQQYFFRALTAEGIPLEIDTNRKEAE